MEPEATPQAPRTRNNPGGNGTDSKTTPVVQPPKAVPPTTPKNPKRKLPPNAPSAKEKRLRVANQARLDAAAMGAAGSTELKDYLREQLMKSEALASAALQSSADERQEKNADAKEERKAQMDLFKTTLQLLADTKAAPPSNPTPQSQGTAQPPYGFPGGPPYATHYHNQFNSNPYGYPQQLQHQPFQQQLQHQPPQHPVPMHQPSQPHPYHLYHHQAPMPLYNQPPPQQLLMQSNDPSHAQHNAHAQASAYPQHHQQRHSPYGPTQAIQYRTAPSPMWHGGYPQNPHGAPSHQHLYPREDGLHHPAQQGQEYPQLHAEHLPPARPQPGHQQDPNQVN
jgi:hypothetical protein